MSGSSSKKGGKKNSKKSGKAGSEADESSSVKNEKGKSKKKRALQAKPVTPESVHWFYYYFCCFCVLPKKFRKNKRKMELERVEQMERDARESATSEAPMDIVAKEAPSLRYKAAVKIQSLVRGCQARQAMTDYWQTAIAEASEHWLKIIRAREMAWLEKERALVARKQVCVYAKLFLLRTQCH